MVCGLRKIMPFKSGKNSAIWPSQQRGHVVANPPGLFHSAKRATLPSASRSIDRLLVVDRAFAENGGLDRPLRFLVVVFQREQQRQIRVAVERPRWLTRTIHRTKARDKTVVGLIELLRASRSHRSSPLPSSCDRRQSRTASRTLINARMRERVSPGMSASGLRTLFLRGCRPCHRERSRHWV